MSQCTCPRCGLKLVCFACGGPITINLERPRPCAPGEEWLATVECLGCDGKTEGRGSETEAAIGLALAEHRRKFGK